MENPATAGFWLSPQQKHVWSLQGDGRAYRSVCLVLIEGAGSLGDVTSAIEQLVARHEILRTIYVHQPGMTYPFQVVLETSLPAIELLDLQEQPESEQTSKLNDLFVAAQVRSQGPENVPVVSADVVALSRDRYGVVLSLPAMSADQSSLNILAQELDRLARGKNIPGESEPLRYVQFAQWQNDLLDGADENAREGLAFWKRYSGEGQPLSIPTERKPTGDFSPQVHECELDQETLAQVRDLAAKVNLSEADVLLAAWRSLLWRCAWALAFWRRMSNTCCAWGP